MFKAGIIDLAKVTCSAALQNAASIAALFLTTEAVTDEMPGKNWAPGAPGAPRSPRCPRWRRRHGAAVPRGLRGSLGGAVGAGVMLDVFVHMRWV